jgi:hypothetical protein
MYGALTTIILAEFYDRCLTLEHKDKADDEIWEVEELMAHGIALLNTLDHLQAVCQKHYVDRGADKVKVEGLDEIWDERGLVYKRWLGAARILRTVALGSLDVINPETFEEFSLKVEYGQYIVEVTEIEKDMIPDIEIEKLVKGNPDPERYGL